MTGDAIEILAGKLRHHGGERPPLVDADAASNPFNWQWVAGSGADAAPYFRVFNPETQRKKFDAHDQYVREWAPEYLGDDPPQPMVDLGETRLVDHTVMEKLHHLQDEWERDGRRLELIGLDAHETLSAHPLAARRKRVGGPSVRTAKVA